MRLIESSKNEQSQFQPCRGRRGIAGKRSRSGCQEATASAAENRAVQLENRADEAAGKRFEFDGALHVHIRVILRRIAPWHVALRAIGLKEVRENVEETFRVERTCIYKRERLKSRRAGAMN